jgi:hypothetical protein
MIYLLTPKYLMLIQVYLILADPANDTLLEIQNNLQTNEGSIDTLLTEIGTKQNIID